MTSQRPFLTAEWRYLLMLNYEIEPSVLTPYLPWGTEIDLFEGRALISIVGFRFLNTKVMGVPIAFHRNFNEVNLRYYVRREVDGEVRRGVCFIKEIVPRKSIATLARLRYGERYIALPMGQTIETDGNGLAQDGLVEYNWRFKGRLNRMGGLGIGDPQVLENGSEEEFISEHYWGYTRLGDRETGEYQVAHPAWKIWQVAQPYLLCDIAPLYGNDFEPFLHRRPLSAFLANGSEIAVYEGHRLRKGKPVKAAR